MLMLVRGATRGLGFSGGMCLWPAACMALHGALDKVGSTIWLDAADATLSICWMSASSRPPPSPQTGLATASPSGWRTNPPWNGLRERMLRASHWERLWRDNGSTRWKPLPPSPARTAPSCGREGVGCSTWITRMLSSLAWYASSSEGTGLILEVCCRPRQPRKESSSGGVVSACSAPGEGGGGSGSLSFGWWVSLCRSRAERRGKALSHRSHTKRWTLLVHRRRLVSHHT